MRNWQAFKTHHKNQTAAAHECRRAIRGTTKGMKAGDASSGAAVAYCSACRAPVVESAAARKRHALKGGKCAEAMRDSGKNPNRREVELGSPKKPLKFRNLNAGAALYIQSISDRGYVTFRNHTGEYDPHFFEVAE